MSDVESVCGQNHDCLRDAMWAELVRLANAYLTTPVLQRSGPVLRSQFLLEGQPGVFVSTFVANQELMVGLQPTVHQGFECLAAPRHLGSDTLDLTNVRVMDFGANFQGLEIMAALCREMARRLDILDDQADRLLMAS